jgi:hypothetical protein
LVVVEGEVVSLLEDHPGDHRMMEMHGVGKATLVVEEGGILDYHDLEVVVGHLGIFVGHHLVLGPSTHEPCSIPLIRKDIPEKTCHPLT